jgi:folate-dependent phosphoribosylglycinamide formyltransferase PurN
VVPGGTLTGPVEPPPTPAAPPGPPPDSGRVVVLLAGPGASTYIVSNFLASWLPNLIVVVEDPPSRLKMASRRARRVGWVSVVGQVLFVAVLQPVLRHRGARRRAAILSTASVDTTPRAPHHRVPSVNDQGTATLLASLRPALVVVHGTRIIAPRVLDSAGCPIINVHAGITPRYRGVHGGYWALVEQHPEWVGTTVHLVDSGIDTGAILAQVTFEITSDDTFATYPELHLVHGLPLLGAQVDKVMAGKELEPLPASIVPGSGFYYHPTIWGYLWRRWRDGVR